MELNCDSEDVMKVEYLDNGWDLFGFTKGNIYTVVDGVVCDDNGVVRRFFDRDTKECVYPGFSIAVTDTTPTEGASKNDSTDGKLNYIYAHPFAQYQMGLALMAGETKYGAWNYLKDPGHKASQLISAVRRHLDKYFYAGEDIDKDTSDRIGSDVHHLACAMAGLNMLLGQIAQNTLQDDRPSPMVTPTTKEEMYKILTKE